MHNIMYNWHSLLSASHEPTKHPHRVDNLDMWEVVGADESRQLNGCNYTVPIDTRNYAIYYEDNVNEIRIMCWPTQFRYVIKMIVLFSSKP